MSRRLLALFLVFAFLLGGCFSHKKYNLEATWSITGGISATAQSSFSGVALMQLPDKSYLYLSVAHGCLAPEIGLPWPTIMLHDGSDDPNKPHKVGVGYVLAVDETKDLCLIRSWLPSKLVKGFAATPPRSLDDIYITGSPNNLQNHISMGVYVREIETQFGTVSLSTVSGIQGISGGPAWNEAGELVGIATSFSSPYQTSVCFIGLNDIHEFLGVALSQLPARLRWGQLAYDGGSP